MIYYFHTEVSLKSKDLLSISDVSGEEIRMLISSAISMKTEGRSSLLSEKSIVLMFEKPSLRTRVSFEMAMRQLGGNSLYLSPEEVGLGKRESIPDVAQVLSRYTDAIVMRTFQHQTIEIMANNSGIPVINALSDLEHPCQAMADLLTIYEKLEILEGVNLAYIGDGNNVAHSLMLASALTGMNFRIASPPGYEVDEKLLETAQVYASESGAKIFVTEDPREAVSQADVVYTDVWTSMGQEDESEQRRRIFADYQINESILSMAKGNALLMHPLPAHHGEEVAENILYRPQSVVFDQAENRMHIQKAILAEILGGLEISLANFQ
jgi:ornithine carbamoyltransferase